MDHPFLTKRTVLAHTREALELLADVATLVTITPADHTRLLERREVDIEDAEVRKAVLRRCDRLGRVLCDIDERAGSTLATDHGAQWTKFLLATPTPPSQLQTDLETLRRTLSSTRDELDAVERDDASSSYSDYSDSHTSTSSSGEEEEGEEEEEVSR